MANGKNYTRGRLGTPAREPGAQQVWEGYTDYARGLGYRPEYDRYDGLRQIRYELGRHYAAIAKAHLGKVPPWPRNRILRLKGVTGGDTTSEHRFMAVPVAA